MLTVLEGDALAMLRTLPAESVQCCVTSPPYWGLRDYSCPGQLGLEPTPELYVARMVLVFREVRRVLRKDGTLWLNLGDSYASGEIGRHDRSNGYEGEYQRATRQGERQSHRLTTGLKPKDLVGIPWRVAFALQADGWYLRSDIIWAKPNPMPESVTDRPTKAHEYVFLLTKSANYFYDAEAIREPLEYSTLIRDRTPRGRSQNGGGSPESLAGYDYSRENLGDMQSNPAGRNKRSVWSVPTSPYPDAHFATYPPDLISPMILAGTSARGCCSTCGAPWKRIIERVDSGRTQKMPDGFATYPGDHGTIHRSGREKGETGVPVMESKTLAWQPSCSHNSPTTPCTVLDPFAGSGTTGQVAIELSRKAILIELNPTYVKLIEQRCSTTIGLLLA